MKIKDLLFISTKNINAHPKRSLLIVTTTSITFGLIITINLWVQGLENSYIELASQTTNGKVVIEATNSIEGTITDNEQLQTARQAMIADIEAYSGRILNDTQKFGAFGSIILPKDLVSNAIEVDLSTVPVDSAPILVPTFFGEQLLGGSFFSNSVNVAKKQDAYEEYRSNLIGKTFIDIYGAKYHVVGLASGNFHINNLSFQQLEQNNKNSLNSILEFITTPEGTPIVIDNGESKKWQTGESMLVQTTEGETIIAVFDDSAHAYDYFKNGSGKFMNVDFPNRTYSVNTIAGMSPETQYVFHGVKLISNIVSVILGIAAISIVVFTSIRLIDQDKQDIALYYNLGASPKQIKIIYLCYFFELMISAIVFTFTVASATVLLFSIVNQELLSTQAMLGFNQVMHKQIIWYGISTNILIIILVMLLMAPLCVAINNKPLGKTSFTISKH